MILEALYQLAARERLIADPDFEDKPVAWRVRVGPGGKLIGIEGTRTSAVTTGGRPGRAIAKSISIPRQAIRTSGDRAFFLCDKAEYVFGIDPQPDTAQKRLLEKLQSRSRLFREEVNRCAEATHDPAVQAVADLLQKIASSQIAIDLSEECQTNDLFAFIYAPDVDVLVHERDAVKRYWKARREVDLGEGPSARCLITGEPVGEVSNFPQVKKVPGGSTSGVSLVSFNSRAFESFGLTGNNNAPISRTAAEASATALNRLVDPNPIFGDRHLARRNFTISDDTIVCFWADADAADDFLDPLASLIMVDDPAKVGDVYRSLWRGIPIQLRDTSAFYALTLSGTQGRAIVRDWFVSSVADVSQHLANHFADLLLVPIRSPAEGKDLPPHLPLKTLLGSLAPPGRNSSTPPQLVAQFVSAALRGTDYPFSILQRALERTRAEISKLNDDGVEGWRARERQDGRAALIKAVLRRTMHLKDLGERMDPANSSPGYLLGRLMAVIERLQQVALGDVNAGVVDRYFAAASATPRAVFVRLLKNARHHARKALGEPQTAGTARWLERQIDEVVAPFDPKQNGFPAHLDLQQQGLFVLGYHQQRHWFWQSKDEREAATSKD